MSKEIFVNVEARETRVAVIESGRLVELHVEREDRVVGSIYKGRVVNVLPGMDAAFVDIGLEKNAFLQAGDVLAEEDTDDDSGDRRGGRRPPVKIRDVARPGQEMLVQVIKGPRGTKGARVSTRVSLPGRYMVFLPDADSVGVSRKIELPQERERLKKTAQRIKTFPCGLIVRTEAEGKSEADLRQDFEFLSHIWDQIQQKAKQTPPGRLVYQDLSLVFKVIRDIFSADVNQFIIDDPQDYEEAVELVEMIAPRLRDRLEHYNDSEPIFLHYGIEQEIERLTKSKIWLKSGGYLIIDEAEALTTIDVNTGKFVGSTSLAETTLKTNLDAVTEVVRQLRLRDMGGMIIIDFIDMSSARDRSHLMSALEKALKKDRVRTKISHISPLGLIEMTRKRTGESLSQILTDTCPYCTGRGRVSAPAAVAAKIERALRHRAAEESEEAFFVQVHPTVAEYLIGPEGGYVQEVEERINCAVFVRADPHRHIEDYRILPGDLQELERQIVRYRNGQTVEVVVETDSILTLPRSGGWSDGYYVDLVNGGEYAGERVKARLTFVHRSYAIGEVTGTTQSRTPLDKGEPI
ncbi:MAG: Rne/Rng family ribonuclease [Armatimonadetes bacterium]|nr:Rne/Rng family ribonuclease [Armatimonadota bacterium]